MTHVFRKGDMVRVLPNYRRVHRGWNNSTPWEHLDMSEAMDALIGQTGEVRRIGGDITNFPDGRHVSVTFPDGEHHRCHYWFHVNAVELVRKGEP